MDSSHYYPATIVHIHSASVRSHQALLPPPPNVIYTSVLLLFMSAGEFCSDELLAHSSVVMIFNVGSATRLAWEFFLLRTASTH